MAEQPQSEESAVSKPTYTTDETAQAIATLLDTKTARNEEPKPNISEEKESNLKEKENILEEDQAELSEDINVDDIVDDGETRLESEEELYDITVQGNNQKVTLDELIKGYSRESDYTKKTQDLGDQRRELNSQQDSLKKELEAVKLTRNQYADQLKVLTDNLKAQDNIDWVKLAQDDPQSYAVQKAEYDKIQELKLAAQQEQQRINQEQRTEQEKVYKQYIAKERQLLAEKLPIYKDETKGKQFNQNLISFAKEIGYSDQEISMLVDHSAVMMLADAYRYNQLKKTKLANKKVNKAPKVVSSNASNIREDSDDAKRINDRMSKLKKSGHLNDAKDVFKEMFFNK